MYVLSYVTVCDCQARLINTIIIIIIIINLVADSGRRLLWLAVIRTRIAARTHNIFGDNSFAAADSQVWKNLQSYLQQGISYAHSDNNWRHFCL